MSSEKVDFGYKKVSPQEKTRRVGGVFASVATRYDVMNDLISLGSHRLIKRMTIQMSAVRKGHRVLDLAGGTGDLAALYSPIVGAEGTVVLSDINEPMMAVGRDRLMDEGLTNITYCQANAEVLPFDDCSFNCVTIGFGLRNVTHKDLALKEMNRVLKPGGTLLVLEFSKPTNPLIDTAYGVFQSLWPGVGKLVTGDSQSYRYLVESIRVHPDQKNLKLMMQDAGLQEVEYHNIMIGVIAIHRGARSGAKSGVKRGAKR